MIELVDTDSFCNACRSKDSNSPKEIKFGISEMMMTCFTLCKTCRKELLFLLKELDDAEN